MKLIYYSHILNLLNNISNYIDTTSDNVMNQDSRNFFSSVLLIAQISQDLIGGKYAYKDAIHNKPITPSSYRLPLDSIAT